MRDLVTGHRGFIWSVMIPALVRDGIDVDGMDTDLYSECTFAGSPASVPEIEGGIRDPARAELEGFDAVIHLAARSNDPLGDINPVGIALDEFEGWKYRRIGQIKQLMEGGRRGPDPLGRDDESSGRIV